MYSKYRQIITDKGISTYKVAKATGISQVTFSEWKKGRSKPKLEKLLLIAAYLEVSLFDLI